MRKSNLYGHDTAAQLALLQQGVEVLTSCADGISHLMKWLTHTLCLHDVGKGVVRRTVFVGSTRTCRISRSANGV